MPIYFERGSHTLSEKLITQRLGVLTHAATSIFRMLSDTK
jgi:hypothetical protein